MKRCLALVAAILALVLAPAPPAMPVAWAERLAGTFPTRSAAPLRTAESSIAPRLARALTVPNVSPERTGAVAVDLSTGAVVFERNADLSLAPASTEKLALSFGLLSRFGPGYRIRTRLLGAGERAGTVWNGDLVLQGRGDPMLSSADLRRLAAQVRAVGIRRVEGGVVGDETFFDERRTAPGWKARYYADESPPLSALSVDRSNARRPALVAAQLLSRALQVAGVAVGRGARLGAAPEDATELAAVTSQPLLALLRALNRESDNFTAEMLLKHLGAVQFGRGTTGWGARAVTDALAAAGVPLEGVRIVDGSGLSRLDRLTARALGALLTAAWDVPRMRQALLASLAVAGMNGTLENRLRAPQVRGRILAKTGTTKVSSSLAGYVNGSYVFAVIQNGSPVSYWWARRAQDRFVTVLAAS